MNTLLLRGAQGALALALCIAPMPAIPRAPGRLAVAPFRQSRGGGDSTAIGAAIARLLVRELSIAGSIDVVPLDGAFETPAEAIALARRDGASMLLIGTVEEASVCVTRTSGAGSSGEVVHATARVRLALQVLGTTDGHVLRAIEVDASEIAADRDARSVFPDRPDWDSTTLGRAARAAVRQLVEKLRPPRETRRPT